MNKEVTKSNYANIDDVIRECKAIIGRCESMEDIEKFTKDHERLCDEMSACGWFQPRMTATLAGLMAMLPAGISSKEQFMFDHILKPCPAFTTSFNAFLRESDNSQKEETP